MIDKLTRREACTVLLLLASGQQLAARIRFEDDGTITVMTGKVELGQGARTELTQAAAEELRVDPAKIRLLMGDTDVCPDDGGTSGSTTTPQTVPRVRTAAAEARRAADKSLTPPSEWKVLGTPLTPVNGRAIVTGALKFPSDLARPGMLHSRIVRSPAYNASLESADVTEAERMGARIVREGNFLGVVAGDARTAEKAAQAVRAKWTPQELPPAADLFDLLKKQSRQPAPSSGGRYPSLLQKGNLAEGFAQADHRLEASYRVAYIAHVPMEPRAAIAEWQGEKLTAWYGTQAPFGIRRELAEALGVPAANVRVISTDLGGGFGGKQRADAAIEAARLAKAAGKPVKVAWTREEEFQLAYFRPAGLIEVTSGVRKDGKIVAWEFHNYNSGAASMPPPYAFPNVSCGFHPSQSPLRQGSYRSLAAVANAFARESTVDELAAAVKMDPVEFRLKNIDNPRLREVLERAAEKFGWGRSKKACGVAVNIEKGGLVALCVSLDVVKGQVRLERMVLAFDVGAILNPDNVRNQAEGCLVMGIGGALFEEIRFDNQRLLNGRLSRYRVPRFSDVPQIETFPIDRRDVPSAGAGESPITVVAPAIAAAIYKATGKRLRSLPLEKALAV